MPRLKPSKVLARDPLRLTPDDVTRLLDSVGGTHAKIDVTGKMAGTYAKGGFGPREAAIAEQIFRLLARDAEVAVRSMLAEHLKSSKELPRDIALSMARDVVSEVALPVLRYSEALTEEDLVALILETREAMRHVAISKREHVSERVSEALVEIGVPEVSESLAANQGALITEGALRTMLARFSGEAAVMRTLARRPGLPAPIVEKLVAHVSASLARELRKKYRLTSTQLAAEEEAARNDATLALLKDHRGREDVEHVVEQLFAYKRLNPPLILTALSRGYLLFFEAAVARLAHVPTEHARRLIHDHGELGFHAVYNQAGLPPERFGDTKRLLAEVCPDPAGKPHPQETTP